MAKKKAVRPSKSKKSTKTSKKPAARVAKASATTRAAPKFFGAGRRGKGAEERKQFHVLLTKDEHEQLAKLTHKMQLSAADVFRKLLAGAK